MAERQIFNLDELVAEEPKRVILWKGEEHEVVGATGETYLKFLTYEGQLNKANSPAEQFEMSLKILNLLTPTIPLDDVKKLRVQAIQGLVNFVSSEFNASVGTTTDDGPPTADGEEDGGPGE